MTRDYEPLIALDINIAERLPLCWEQPFCYMCRMDVDQLRRVAE